MQYLITHFMGQPKRCFFVFKVACSLCLCWSTPLQMFSFCLQVVVGPNYERYLLNTTHVKQLSKCKFYFPTIFRPTKPTSSTCRHSPVVRNTKHNLKTSLGIPWGKMHLRRPMRSTCHASILITPSSRNCQRHRSIFPSLSKVTSPQLL